MSAKTHECLQLDRSCDAEEFFYGPAIASLPLWDDDKEVWYVFGGSGGSREYGTQVWFCPFCGEELR